MASHMRPLLAALAALLVLAPAAMAAQPRPNARFEVHDHEIGGRNWHVEATVSSTGRSLRHLILYVEQCDATVVARAVRVGEDGMFAVNRAAEGTTWSVTGSFTTPTRLEGTYRLARGGCDTGRRAFTARGRGGVEPGHDHGSHGHDHGDVFPDLAAATAAQRAQARRLHRATLSSARRLFPTYAAARNRGFVRFPRNWRRPLVFHLRQRGYEQDGRVLDPSRPESLVYWWPRRGRPVLVGFMYRAPVGRRPSFGGPLLIWHGHDNTQTGRRGRTIMTHVWLTRDLRSALANCLPVPQLEAALPRFRYARPGTVVDHNSRPCPTSSPR
jgi:Spy/CpxP family protein refolding chaperone